MNAVYQGDCLTEMRRMQDQSISALISDLPYGTTYANWDTLIPIDQFWAECKRILKPGGAVVLTASQPFTSLLVVSNIKWFRCEWIWDKVNAANFANANRQPLKTHESVLVFCDRQPVYNPQKTKGKPNHIQGTSNKVNASETRLIRERIQDDLSGLKFPKSIQTFAKHSSQCGLHPTQKPVDLFRYLIRTYTNAGDLILDPCCGSGTTCLAARLEGRNFIGVDSEEKYVRIANERLYSTKLEFERGIV